MVSMNERFEMRLDGDTLVRVDEWRRGQPDMPSRAEAMRRLVEAGLVRSSRESVSFSDGEKVLILMVRDLYKHLGLTPADTDADFLAEVIFGGHYWAPKWRMQGVFHDYEDDPKDLRYVIDVLEMWDFIEGGYSGLSKKDKAAIEKAAVPFGKHLSFMGFDGNGEGAELGIAGFLINDMERFSRFKGRDLNSHMPTRDIYSRMLRAFEPIRKSLSGGYLNANQITSVLKAAKYSE